ncbi:MAG: aldo/keto reductase [Eubacteriales bacterium]
MKYQCVKDLNLSAFSLGTVQLGMNYGINNNSGKPSRESAFAILDKAMDTGVNSLDTANDYGDAEVIIGEWLKTRKDKSTPLITTKISHLDHRSLASLRRSVREQVDGCKQRLGLKQLPVLMLHDFADYDCDRENMRLVFNELKESGDIRFSAISAYSRHDYSVLAESGVDAVQIPLNIFDWAQIDNGGIQKLSDKGIMIFVRSAFLQGLIFKQPEDLESQMAFCKPALTRFHAFCDEFRLSPAVLAMSFLMSLKGITCLVLGCEKEEQVVINADLINQTIQLNTDQMNSIHEAFCLVDPKVLNPGTWFNAAK